MFGFHQSALKFGFPSAHQNVKHQRQACFKDYLGEFGSPANNNDQSFCMSWLSGMFSQSAAPHFKCWRLKMCLLATALFIDTAVTHMFIATRPLWLRNFRHFLCFFSVCVCVYSATLDSWRVFFPLKYFPLQYFACHDVTDTIPPSRSPLHHSRHADLRSKIFAE